MPGGGRERSRLIFYILSAAMQERTRACRRLRAFRVVHAVG